MLDVISTFYFWSVFIIVFANPFVRDGFSGLLLIFSAIFAVTIAGIRDLRVLLHNLYVQVLQFFVKEHTSQDSFCSSSSHTLYSNIK